ncbi:hypothetical protein [Ramlibacter sp. AN1133]|uniref:hypothetical protein n=1 Tax=Ramlibacter sp. AN1133 TaxID=3133429 RepID=UPI0030BAFB16
MSRNAGTAHGLVSGFAALLLVATAHAQVTGRSAQVETGRVEKPITVHTDPGSGPSSSSGPNLVGGLAGIARAPSITITGGPSETTREPTLPERWLRNDAAWLDRNLLRWMDRHPVLLKQP